jgi:hypothetical protein
LDEATGKWGIRVNRVELKAIDPPGSILEAIHRGRPDPQLLAYQYLQTLPKLASGDGNHTWLIPSELTRALDAFASGCLDRRTEQTSTSGPPASGEAAGAPQMPPMVIPARPTADGRRARAPFGASKRRARSTSSETTPGAPGDRQVARYGRQGKARCLPRR